MSSRRWMRRKMRLAKKLIVNGKSYGKLCRFKIHTSKKRITRLDRGYQEYFVIPRKSKRVRRHFLKPYYSAFRESRHNPVID